MPRWPAKIRGRSRVHGVLTLRQEDKGYYVVEESDHIITLWHHNTVIGAYSSSGPTAQTLRDTVEQDILRRE